MILIRLFGMPTITLLEFTSASVVSVKFFFVPRTLTQKDVRKPLLMLNAYIHPRKAIEGYASLEQMFTLRIASKRLVFFAVRKT